ncbi:carboxyl transferase domain-containing protein [Corynebacterium sp.]|uniref:carboxyl transferase domain-containing protein n=1 Tax=Corynebacterium sp. TaxID=1720 RepID=UPI0026DB943E|nr:carboxyl transferase domain-containing protein [Corynebacterium sp.]MDO5031149.1 carboxyl transferase domain-containing protein [Corynebacterium sp.]
MKTTAGKIEDLGTKLTESRAPHGEVPPARSAIEALFDAGSFVETDALARHRSTDFGREHIRPYTDGVITGYGTVAGRKVCAYAQDATIFDGTMGEVYGEKVTKLYDLAIKTGVPVVALVASDKPRAQEGIVSSAMQARILARATTASGLVPQVTVVYADSKDASLVAALADVVIAPDGHLSAQQPGGEIDAVKQVLSYLPSNNRAEAPRPEATLMAGSVAENISEADRALDSLVADDGTVDLLDVITATCEDTLELEAGIEGIYTGFGHVEGRTVGIVANRGTLDSAAAAKAARFIRLCDAFNTPIVEFVDSPALGESVDAASLAKLIHAYSAATVGKLSVIVGRAHGTGYIAFGSKDLGADMSYAWPTAEISVADAEALAQELELDAEQAAEYLTPYQAAERGLVDSVITPAATRGSLIEALRLLERKIVPTVPKKHGNIVL